MRTEQVSSGPRQSRHHYRHLWLTRVPSGNPSVARHESDRWPFVMILLVGAIRPLQAVIRHEDWGAEAVLGALMAVFAARILIADLLVSWLRTPPPR